MRGCSLSISWVNTQIRFDFSAAWIFGMKVRGQHYVWRHYLGAWAVSGQVHCLRDGRVFRTDPKNVGKERDFYRLRELTDADVQMARETIRASPEHIRRLHENLLLRFASLPRLRAAASPAGLGSKEADEALEEAIVNLEELLHGGIERSAQGFLARARNGDVSFYDDDKAAADFLYFLSVQYMRTKGIRENVVAGMAAKAPGIYADVDRVWNILSHIFATNIGWSLYAERRTFRLVLMTNGSQRALITSDQPVINTLGRNDGAPPDELELYYPISPRRGLLLTKGEVEEDRKTLTESDVQHYNSLIASRAHEMIFGDSEIILLGVTASATSLS